MTFVFTGAFTEIHEGDRTCARLWAKKPFGLGWYVDRKAKYKFFDTDPERQKWKAKFEKDLKKHGVRSLKTDPKRMQRWEKADAIIGDADPVEVAEFWLRHRRTASNSVTWNSLEKDWMTLLENEIGEAEARHVAVTFHKFKDRFGDVPISELEPRELHEWLYGLPLSDTTKRNYRRNLNVPFEHYRKLKVIDYNPWADVAAPKAPSKDPGTLTMEETEHLYRVNEQADTGACALMALGDFGGMRASAIRRVEWDDIDWQNKGIITPAYKTKKRRRQYIQGHPDNMWAWLKLANKEDFADPFPKPKSSSPTLAEKEAIKRWERQQKRRYEHRRAEALKRAGLLVEKGQKDKDGNLPTPKHPPQNYARHGFVSNHIAAFENMGKTHKLISHSGSTAELQEHYLGAKSKQDGERHFRIRPNPQA